MNEGYKSLIKEFGNKFGITNLEVIKDDEALQLFFENEFWLTISHHTKEDVTIIDVTVMDCKEKSQDILKELALILMKINYLARITHSIWASITDDNNIKITYSDKTTQFDPNILSAKIEYMIDHAINMKKLLQSIIANKKSPAKPQEMENINWKSNIIKA
ncbi:MAG: CesT family type III secretion system chaperone [Desulfobacterales bacterium]|nr:CesT family type III secretion system chaperone [Desulfobacterales bacterium]MBF0396849.1 CesT family type III secretion system chaperone [Desulfobacterales bacterium]